MDLSNISSWPEWFACAVVIGVVILGHRFHKASRALVILLVVLAWTFGTAKGLLFPLTAGGLIWIFPNTKKRAWRKVGEVVVIGGALAAALLCWVFPLPVPPPLSGPHDVGTFSVELPAEGGSPRLLFQMWYPSDQEKNMGSLSWLPDADLAPAFPYHRLKNARAHARPNVLPVSEESPLRVIFYEHSWMGHRAENVVQVEDLASRGFVIVAIDHPGQAERVRYSDGSVVVGCYSAPLDFSSSKAEAAFEATAEQCFIERMAQVERVRLALNGDVAGNLRGRLKLDRVGVFGFSFGGSTALRLCSENPAFHAGANEDGLFLGTGMPRGPFLFFDQEMPAWLKSAPQPGEDAGQALTRVGEARIQEAMRHPGSERVILDGTRHLSFSDRIYASPFSRLARVGTRPAGEVHEILSTRLNAFFKAGLGADGAAVKSGF